MEDLRLGQLIETPRVTGDAIHIAVAPVVAAEKLQPGERIGFVESGNIQRVGSVDKPIGIVDPFLSAPVKPEQRFWMFLFPGTITSLRHEWTHPAFANAIQDEPPDKAASERWLRDAAIMLGVDYDDLVSDSSPLVRDDYINNGETIRGRWYEISDEFWKHRQIVTGKDVPEDDRGGFTCSC